MISLSLALPTVKPKDALLVGVVRGESGPEVARSDAVDEKRATALAALARTVGVQGERDEVVRAPGDVAGYPLVVFTGIGPEVTLERLRQAAGAAMRTLRDVTAIDVALPAGDVESVAAVAEGLHFGAYRFSRYRAAEPAPREARILTAGAKDRESRAALERAAIVADAVDAVRELVNTSPADLYPESFARHAADAGRAARLAVREWDEDALREGGFGGLLAVGSGSARPPRLVRVDYSPRRARAHVALVGKGITFDSGGLSLKQAKGMHEMKADMAGAAAVLATVVAASRLGLDVHVTGWLALAENMPSGSAQRPSDVITIRGGTTVEVLDTDAEGRLVLADALVAAREENPDVIVDVATLTGSQAVALGNRVAAVMGEESTRSDVLAAAEVAGEQMWPMPLPDALADSLRTPMADLANKGERNGGMLVAGLFLRHFVGEGRWAHLDIAGPAYTDTAWGYTPQGGTGFAVRTLVGLLENVER